MDVEAVVAEMTLEEKCACLTGAGYWELGGCPRLGVAPLAVSDGPHGLRRQAGAADNLGLADSEPAVCFPTASAAACTFDADLVRAMGEALGDEAREQGVAVVGAFAREPRYQGAGSSKINPVSLDCAFDELAAAGMPCAYAAGYDADTGETTEALLAEAARVAAASDAAVVFAGLPDAAESEGADRADMALPVGHDALVERVCAANPNTAVVLQGGAPVELPWRGKPRAVLLSYLSGCRGGRATADLLTGRANPSGKLAETWPARLADTPCVGSFPEKGRQALYRESVYTGYRYYDAADIPVAYPFGHGLSYTTFSYRDLRVEPQADGDGYAVSCLVRNDGERAGREAVQLYVAPLDPGAFRPPQELKAFAKVALGPGEERRVELDVPLRAFAHYDVRAGAWLVEAGPYELRAAASSRDVRLRARVEVPGAPKRDDGAPAAYRRVRPGGFADEAFLALHGRPLPKTVVAMRPYTANATVGDLKSSLVGRAVHYVLRHELRLLLPGDAGKRAQAELAVMDTPLRALAMSGVDMNLVGAVVDIMNYRFVRDIRRLCALGRDRDRASGSGDGGGARAASTGPSEAARAGGRPSARANEEGEDA